MQYRRIPVGLTLTTLLFAGLLAGNALAQKGIYVAEGLAVTIKPPAKWTYLGRHGDLGALRAIYCAPREYASLETRSRHSPTLRILWFPKQAAADANAKKSEWPMRTPYKDTKDYIDRCNGGRSKIVDVAVGNYGKFQGRRYVAETSRLVGRGETKLTLHVCAIKLEKGELAVSFEVLTEQHKKLRKGFENSLMTLGRVDPKKVKKPLDPPTPQWVTDYESWAKRPLADRKKIRKAYGDQFVKARKAEKNGKWKVTKSKSFVVVSRTDAKYTKRITQAAESARVWADKNFANISDDLVVPAVLRIFDSRRELNTFRLRERNPPEYHPERREFYAFKNSSVGNLGDGYGDVVRGAFFQYIHDKHPHILGNLPRWVDNGFWGMFFSSRVVKGKNLIFFPSDVETGRFKYHADHNAPQKTWWFIQEKMDSMLATKDGSAEPNWGYTPECTRLLRWWLEGGGDGVFMKENVLSAYLKQIGDTAVKFAPRPDKDVDWQRLDEGQAKQVRLAASKRRDEFLIKVNYSVIGIPTNQWPKVDAAWQAYNVEFATRKFKKK